MDVPRITYYAKVIDNLTGKDITNYKNAMDNDLWYYGKINSNLGGESQFIVEFDIWNNEPSFNHRTFDVKCKDAKNMKLGIEVKKPNVNDDDFENDLYNVPFFYARSLTNGYDEEYKLIDSRNKLSIVGNLDPSKNILSGAGDHCIVQTKLIIPEGVILKNQRFNFNITLEYDFE